MIILDCEASGLALKSYPIEVAWLNIKTFEEDSFLINPFSCTHWDYWDHSAELIHGISVNQLIEEGISVQEAAKRLTDSLAGQQVYTDCPAYDCMWVQRLYSTAKAPLDIRFADVFDLVNASYHPLFSRHLRKYRRPHRALKDCYAIHQAYDELPDEAYLTMPSQQIFSNVS